MKFQLCFLTSLRCRLEKSRSHRILWMMEELGIPYELKTFKRSKDLLAPPELKQIHPLGKSPVISIDVPGGKPLVLAESGLIVEYLAKHYGQPGKEFVPKEWQEGKENTVGGETEEWIRYRYYMHFAEGSLMPFLVLSLVVQRESLQHCCSGGTFGVRLHDI